MITFNRFLNVDFSFFVFSSCHLEYFGLSDCLQTIFGTSEVDNSNDFMLFTSYNLHCSLFLGRDCCVEYGRFYKWTLWMDAHLWEYYLVCLSHSHAHSFFLSFLLFSLQINSKFLLAIKMLTLALYFDNTFRERAKLFFIF
jgi:hypothetical protein